MAATKTILQVLPSLKGGGVERGTIEMAEAIKAAGMECVVVSAGGAMVKELEKLHAEHITLPVATKNPFKIIANIGKIAKVIKDKNVSLVHVRSRAPAWSVYYACKRTGVPFIATFHGQYGVKPAIKKIYNGIMLKGRKVIAVSEFIARHIRENYKIDEGKIVTIPRGADVARFSPGNVSQAQIDALRQEWKVPKDKKVILVPGRISPIKGIEIMIEAVRDLPGMLLLVVGSDHGREEYKKQLMSYVIMSNLSDRVQFHPPHKNIEIALALCDICACPSVHPEAFGRTVVEAQSMGKIVIAANHGGATETIEDGRTGFLVDVGSAEAMRGALERVEKMSEGEVVQMRAAARRSANDKYSIERMCRSTINLYREILGVQS